MEEKLNEAAVWSRVTAASREGPESRDTGPIGPELLAAMERNQAIAGSCRQLLSRVGGEQQRGLRLLLQQAQQCGRALAALYYFLTGQRPCLSQSPQQPRREAPADGLRRMMQQAELEAGRMEALAARSTGEAREALLTLCRQQRQQFHTLLGLLGLLVER